MAPRTIELPPSTSRQFSEAELSSCLTAVRQGPVGDGPYESKQFKRTKRDGSKVNADEGEVKARGLASALRQHLMDRSDGRYVEARGEGREAGTTLRTKVWQAENGWHYAVFEAQQEASEAKPKQATSK